MEKRRALIEPGNEALSVAQQCKLVCLPRSSYYRAPAPESPETLDLMAAIDRQHLETPFYGSRQMVRHLCRSGFAVGRKRVRRLMRKMGLACIYQKPRTSDPCADHKVFPYLLRGLVIDRPNQVWCTDITYIQMRRGFLYLVAVMDWASRRVLAWRLSNTMDVSFCIEALDEAMGRHGRPEIFNTDQGSQFTSSAFTRKLEEAGIRVSMDGRGRWMDNVFIERLWRSLKYECVYLNAFDTGSQARIGIGAWIDFYNTRRPHSSLKGATPDEAYLTGLPVEVMDKAKALPTVPQAHQQQKGLYAGKELAA